MDRDQRLTDEDVVSVLGFNPWDDGPVEQPDRAALPGQFGMTYRDMLDELGLLEEGLPVGEEDPLRDAPTRAGPYTVDNARRFRAGDPRRVGAYRVRAYASERDPAVTITEFAQDLVKEVEKLPPGAYRHSIVAFEDPDGYIIRRTVHGSTVDELADQLARIQGERSIAGSDTIPEEYSLQTDSFQISSVVPPAGGGLKFTGISSTPGRRHPHFELKDFSGKSKEGDCLFSILRAVRKARGMGLIKTRNTKLRQQLGLEPGSVPATDRAIGVLASAFGLRVRVLTGMVVPPDEEREFDDNPARPLMRNRCTTVACPQIIAEGGAEESPACDVYLADDHYEYIAKILEPIRTCPITGDMILMDETPSMASIRRRVIAQGRTWFAAPERGRQRARIIQRDRVIVYDYETVYDKTTGLLEPYALGYTVFDPEGADDDFSAKAADVTLCIRAPGTNRFGVSSSLLETILAAEDDVRYTLVSFNGARFDHFLLAEAAHNHGCLKGAFATASGGLRSLQIGRHSTLDLAKLIPATSLASACRDFRTFPTKVDGFSHTEVQKQHQNGTLFTWLNDNRARLEEYLTGDVLSEASLFVKLSLALSAVTGKPIYGHKSCQTIGGHAWELMSAKCSLPAPVATLERDQHIRRAVVGGRVQVYRTESDPPTGPAKPIMGERLYMLDFASLYPTAMAAVPKAAAVFDDADGWGLYPTGLYNGEPRETDAFVPGQVGVYEVTIHEQPPGLPNVLPRRAPGSPLDWDYRGEFDGLATHIDIALIRGGGGRVTVHSGLVWPRSSRGLFKDFILPLAELKDRQDQLAAAGSPEANPSLRMVYKLLMNSASGKCCQQNYDDMVELATGSSQQLSAERKMDQTKPITWIPIGGETCIIIGKKPTDKIYKKRAKPSILSVLIYSYSRALVWKTLCQHNVLYSDTDSGLFRKSDYEAVRAAFPDMDPTGRRKELGDLEQELAEHSSADAFRIAAKDYAVFLRDADGALLSKSKIRIKGVNMRSDRLIVNPGALSGLDVADMTNAYSESSLDRSWPLSDISVAREFYRLRSAGERVTVLSSQITRSYKDSDAPFSLRQRFLVKGL